MFFKREVMFFELPGAGGNNIFWAPRTVYFNLYAFCGASDINNFWQCLHILYECVFDSFTGTDLALAPTSILSPSLSLIIFISSILHLSLISEPFFFSLKEYFVCCILYFIVMLIITFPEYACLTFIDLAVLITFPISFSIYLFTFCSISMLDEAWVPWFVPISFNL